MSVRTTKGTAIKGNSKQQHTNLIQREGERYSGLLSLDPFVYAIVILCQTGERKHVSVTTHKNGGTPKKYVNEAFAVIFAEVVHRGSLPLVTSIHFILIQRQLTTHTPVTRG